MSKLEELIEELCPEGVEYKMLGEVCFKTSNIVWSKNKENTFNYIDLTSVNRNLHIIEETSEINIGNAPSRAQKIVEKDDILFGTTRPMLKRFCIITNEYKGQICSTGFCVLRANATKVLPKFIYYQISKTEYYNYIETVQRGSAYPAVNDIDVKKYKIPLPSLPIQEEIVRILDNFTELTAELIAELTTEFTARKKQYEYYRDSLLTFGDHVEWKTLNQISVNYDSKRRPVTKSDRDAGIYPYYGASGIVDYVSGYTFDGDYLLVSEDGANLAARNTPIAFSISGKTWVNNHAHILQFDNYATRRFVEIYLNSIDLGKYISTAAQPKLTKENLNKIPIPVPQKDEIERIVANLDRFDTIVADITTVLPAEIEARKQQYEYYRDKLLQFKIKNGELNA